MDRPSILDGLHWKLLGNGLVGSVGFVGVPVQSELVSRTVPRGIWLSVATAPLSGPFPKTKPSAGKRTPFPRTVIPAPSYAPISDGSCKSSARLPLTVVSHPTMPSSGKRSTCGLLAPPFHPFHPVPGQLCAPVES